MIRTLTAAVVMASLLLGARAAVGAEGPSANDRAAAKAALEAVAAGRWSVADTEAAAIRDPLSRKLVTWYSLAERREGSTFEEIAEFLRDNPDWPWARRLRYRAEAAPVVRTSDQALLTWIQSHSPVTTEGDIRKIDVLVRLGRTSEAEAAIRATWHSDRFSESERLEYLSRFGSSLRPEDHVRRADALLWQERYREAREMLDGKLIPEPQAALVRARLVLQGSKRPPSGADVAAALDGVPADLRGDQGLRYDLVRWYRQTDQDDKAISALGGPMADQKHPSRWWTERAILVRRLLRNGDMERAYQLASDHRQSGDGEFTEGEWLAGWIALRFARKPALARDHFNRIFAVANYPITKARGAYWSGRAAQMLGDSAAATRWYTEAVQHPTTFYGQFAAARLGRTAIELPPDTVSTPDHRAALAGRELARAARLLDDLGMDDLVRPFMSALFNSATSSGEWAAIGAFALDLGRPDLAVRGAKFSKRPGDFAANLAYPRIELPSVAASVEAPLVLALIRQESEFYAKAVSPAGARGLMQLMPSTAKRTAKALKIAYSKGNLLDDPKYNMQLGRAHLAELLEEWQGSYVLAIAAYNAGSHRVSTWIETYGDPRGADEETTIDWIEMIPYSETRNYVQRVLEGLQVYRIRQGDKRLAAAEIDRHWQGKATNLASDGKPACAGDADSAKPAASGNC